MILSKGEITLQLINYYHESHQLTLTWICFITELDLHNIRCSYKTCTLTGTAMPSYSSLSCGFRCKICHSVKNDGSETNVTSWWRDLTADLVMVALSLLKYS